MFQKIKKHVYICMKTSEKKNILSKVLLIAQLLQE